MCLSHVTTQTESNETEEVTEMNSGGYNTTQLEKIFLKFSHSQLMQVAMNCITTFPNEIKCANIIIESNTRSQILRNVTQCIENIKRNITNDTIETCLQTMENYAF